MTFYDDTSHWLMVRVFTNGRETWVQSQVIPKLRKKKQKKKTNIQHYKVGIKGNSYQKGSLLVALN